MEMKYSDMCAERAQTSLLQLYDFTAGTTRILKEFPYVIEAPNWSHDGTKLYYNARGAIYEYDLSTGISRKINTGEADTCNNDHVLSPDGQSIAVSSGKNDDFSSQIYIVDLKTEQIRQITELSPSYLHGWSPDGITLAYCAERGGEWDIYTLPLSGGEERRLTFSEGLNDGPEYSPDGKKIWFNSVRTGRMQIWRMNTDGTQQEQMTFDDTMNSWFAHVSPDGKKVVYLSYHQEDLAPGEHVPDKNVEIRMIPSEGGHEETLICLFGGQGSINVNSWAPDSNKFAFVSYRC